ncbi:MAG: MOSC domain-containing protein [Chloroflexi bacterium]|nr:MOSC domain-containing protein [Chloroflexota bacterium]
MLTVSGLYIYPIKGCRGISLSDAVVEDIGLAHDRRMLVVDNDGTFLSQREVPSMALIEVVVHADGWLLSAPNVPSIVVTPTTTGPLRLVTIWRDTSMVVDQGDAVATWLRTLLGQPCRLVVMAPSYRRLVSPDFALKADDAVSFADGYASLITNAHSLDDLNTKLTTPVSMNRFRPNIVVSGAPAWDEDAWHEIRLGDVEVTAVKPCARCVVTTTDQLTGERSHEPLATMSSFRKIGHGVIFGQNLIHRTHGVIRVGDTVTITRRRE